MRGFWDKLKAPIVGLSPMDGVTDAPFREIVSKYSQPDLVMTEFTNVEGLARGSTKMIYAFFYSEIERPVVAQVYGVEVESFYKTCVMLCRMGFDGIDINMGCPANKVAKRGSGAGLIKTPELAKKIVRRCKDACRDWKNGISMEKAGVHPRMIKEVLKLHPEIPERREIPVSVKTRTGFDKPIAEEWVKHLLETEPANISMHGRTLRQMYLGEADWEEIARAGRIVKESGLNISYLGNGDVHSMSQAREYSEKYGCDGVLIGRATFGNPWFFSEKADKGEISLEEKFEVAIEHAHLLESYTPELHFLAIRKHLGWYFKGFDGARDLRVAMMKIESAAEVEEVIEKWKKEHLR